MSRPPPPDFDSAEGYQWVRGLAEVEKASPERHAFIQHWQALGNLMDGLHDSHVAARIEKTHRTRSEVWNDIDRHGFRVGHQYSNLIEGVYLDRLAVMFRDPPELMLVDGNGDEVTGPVAEQWESDQEAAELDEVLPDLESQVALYRQQAVSPSWRRGQVVWDFHPPQHVTVVRDPQDPQRLRFATAIELSLPSKRPDILPSSNKVYLDDDEHRLLWAWNGADQWAVWFTDRDGRPAKENPLFGSNRNPYRVRTLAQESGYPIVLWRERRPPKGAFWLPPRFDWLQDAIGANLRKMDLEYVIRYQAFSQLFLAGWQRGEDPGYGPDVPLISHREANEVDARFLTPSPNIEGVLKANEELLRKAAVEQGLPPDTWASDSTTRNAFAKKIEHHALELRRKKLRPMFMRALRRTFEAHKAVANHWAREAGGRVEYPEDVQLRVELAPIPFPRDDFQAAQSDGVNLENGTTDVIEIISRRDGITRSEAELKAERYKETRERFEPPKPAPPPDAVPGDGIQRIPELRDVDTGE